MTKLDSIPVEIQDSGNVKYGTLSYWDEVEWVENNPDIRDYYGMRNPRPRIYNSSLSFWNIEVKNNIPILWNVWFFQPIDSSLKEMYPFLPSCDKEHFVSYIPKKYVDRKKEIFLFDEKRKKYYSFQLEKIAPPKEFPFNW